MKLERLFVLLCLPMLLACKNSPEEHPLYLFTYFVDQEAGMHLAVSEDGLNWYPLNQNQPVLKSYVGDSLLRDPSIVRDDEGIYHLVFTTSFGDFGFGYTHSKDLVNWAPQQFIPVAKGPLADSIRNAWAPEIFYDTPSDEYYIIWASAQKTIPTLQTGFKGDHRQYFIKTRDFENFTEPALFYQGHFHDQAIIDTYVVRPDSLYYFFFKIEATNLQDGGKDGIHWMSAPSLQGPYSAHRPIPNARGNSEGPTCIQVDDQWILYYDAPKGAARTSDWQHWEDITQLVKYPEGFRHGSVITVDRQLLQQGYDLPPVLN